MTIQLFIEIATSADQTTTEKGEILESFAKSFLETQNFSIQERLRLTGIEVDLLATENTTGEKVFVECKAHRSAIAAEVITKIYGTIGIRGYSSGWLISTAPLTKDASGIKEEWNLKPPEERRRLQIYEPGDLIQRLISAKVVIDPERLIQPPKTPPSQAYILITNDDAFWAIPTTNDDAGILDRVQVFHANTGVQVTDKNKIAFLAQADTSLNGLSWAQPSEEIKPEVPLDSQVSSIVLVSSGDDWTDYRPARPQDYIGREELLDHLLKFFDTVRSENTRTRLFAIRGPSGWGKSSTILKLEAKAHNTRNKNKYFVHAVDCRAALSARFPEIALISAVKRAIKLNFVSTLTSPALGSISNPFDTSTMQEVVAQLKAEGKVIVLIFDQFEELLYKEELSSIFDEVRRLCDAVGDAQSGFIIGFSWKTDGTIPAEHPAYHLWHGLSDRRKEFSILPFSKREIGSALSRFSKELGGEINPQLRRVLSEQCQGFPWLLKKLCVHVLDMIRGGTDQNKLLGRTLSIGELFNKDLQLLSATDTSCAKQIAAESPADFFRMVDLFGNDVVHSLLDKRLVIRSGPKLVIYWDIFRDYLLTGNVPNIPITYIPQSNIGAFLEAIPLLREEVDITYGELADPLGLSLGAVDNLVRDLVMLGFVEAQRALGRIVVLIKDERSALKAIEDFVLRHATFREALFQFGVNTDFDVLDFVEILKKLYSSSKFSSFTLEVYAQKLLAWFRAGGFCVHEDGKFRLKRDSTISRLPEFESIKRRREPARFLGEAPPHRVLTALMALGGGEISREDSEKQLGRNAIYALRSLGAIEQTAIGIRCRLPVAAINEGGLKALALRTDTVQFALEQLAQNPKLGGQELGRAIAHKFAYQWVEGSEKRAGIALRKWAKWASR